MANTLSRAEVAAELLARRRALETLDGFREYLASCELADVALPPAKHHKLLTSRLVESLDGKGPHRVVVLPPGAGKSVYSSVQAPLFAAARRPNTRIICVSATANIANSFAIRRRSLANTAEFQRLGATPVTDSLENLMFSNGSSIRSLGAGATVSGLRAELIIADDLVASAEEAASADRLSDLWRWWIREMRPRLVPNGKIFLIGTRWSTRDPIGRVLAENDTAAEPFDLLHIPMIAVDADDPLGRKPGESLWPEWFNDAFLQTARSDPSTFAILFQGRPRDAAGVWIEADKLVTVPLAPSHGTRLCAVDIALSEPGRGDRTARVAGVLAGDRTLYIVDVETEQSSKPDKLARNTMRFANRHDAVGLYADDDNATRSWQALTAEIGRTEGMNPVPLTLLPMGGKSKEVRAAALQGMLNSGRVKFIAADWNQAVFEELLNFPGGNRDDILDALSLLARAVQRLTGQDAPTPEEERLPMIIMRGGVPYLTEFLDDMFKDRDISLRRARRRA